MRRLPTAVMSAASVTVIVLSLRTSPGQRTAATLAPAGVVQPSGTGAAPSAAATGAGPTPAGASATPRRSQPGTSPAAPARSTTAPMSTTPPTGRPAVPTRTAATSLPAPRATHKAAPTTTAVNGQAVDTRYGPVQVQIQVRSGRIVRADAIDYPQGSGRDQEINSQAVPHLDQETLSAQSAQIDTVSGATYTSDGYRQSLQSALDAAHKAGAL